MYRLILAAALLVSLPFLGGCASGESYDGTGRSPPNFKLVNGTRLAKECGWFYAALQDTIFGIDYYTDMEKQFPGSPYE